MIIGNTEAVSGLDPGRPFLRPCLRLFKGRGAIMGRETIDLIHEGANRGSGGLEQGCIQW